jgi:hypothetical protein
VTIPLRQHVVAMFVLVAAGCSSQTKVVETWREPSFKGPIEFKKTMVVAMGAIADRYQRNTIEDTLVEKIGRDRAVAAHDVLSDEDRDPAKLRAKLPTTDIDGVLTFAIVGVQGVTGRGSSAATDVPFYTYYDNPNAFLISDAGPRPETVYRVETRIYELDRSGDASKAGGRLIWRAVTDTVKKENPHATLLDVAQKVGDELRRQKMIR